MDNIVSIFLLFIIAFIILLLPLVAMYQSIEARLLLLKNAVRGQQNQINLILELIEQEEPEDPVEDGDQ